MERVKFVLHEAATILVVDLSGSADLEENIAVLAKARAIIGSRPPKSMLLLTNVTGTPFNVRNVDDIKAYAKFNTPYVKASAVVGVTGIKKVILDAVIRLTGRSIVSFATEEEALDWLAAQ
jgi:hypothetical protein